MCPKVLIVDDEAFNLIVLDGIMQSLNVQKVDKAYNGKEALLKIDKNQAVD